MASPQGPVFEGSLEEFAVTEGGEEYRILYLPDKNNEALQEEGKPPHYYWLPNKLRIARGPNGDGKFHLTHFSGIQGEDETIGAEEDREVAGGVLALTVTGEPPDGVLEQAHEKLRAKFKGKDDRYWGWQVDAAPRFGVVPIASNITTLSNIAPDQDGNAPGLPEPEDLAEEERSGEGRAGEGRAMEGGEDPRGGVNRARTSGGSRSAARSRPRPGGEAEGGESGSSGSGGAPPGTGAATGSGSGTSMARGEISGPPVPMRQLVDGPKSIPQRDLDGQRSNLDVWYVRMDGEGAGSIDPAGENAFSAILGSYPTAILWQGFHGSYSPMFAVNAMKLKVWSENIHLKITADSEDVYTHLSGHATGGYKWFKADLKGEFNKMVKEEVIDVELSIDGTTPDADEHMEAINKRMDLILDRFLKMAQDVIFKPPEKEEAAEAPETKTSFFKPWGVGIALKARHDVTKMRLSYEESISTRYLMDHVVKSSLEGFYDEMKADPDAERKYFSRIFLSEWDAKVHRVAKPIVRWEDPAEDWVGDPVAFLSAQFGYPTTRGDVLWRSEMFDQGNEGPWVADFERKSRSDVSDPPEGWDPDQTFIKRRVHYREPPGADEYPHAAIQIEKDRVELDPGERGTLTSEVNHEVRVNTLRVGPITLDAFLSGPNEYVEVAFRAAGTTDEGEEREWVRLGWRADDQDEPRFWLVYPGQTDFVPSFTYQVRVVVKGSLTTAGKEWVGPERRVDGSGPLMVDVPTQEEAVVSRSLTPMEAATPDAEVEAGPMTSTGAGGSGRPPTDERAASGTEGYGEGGAREKPSVRELATAGGGSEERSGGEEGDDESGPVSFSKTEGWTVG